MPRLVRNRASRVNVNLTLLQVYCLNSKNFERFVTKKYPNTMDFIRLHAEAKLRNRSRSVQGAYVPLLRHLLFKMTDEQRPVSRHVPPLRLSKELPNDAALYTHLFESFRENKAELCAPAMRGSVYVREVMREKARVRHEVNKQRDADFKARRERQTQKKVYDKPRTVKELKAALEKQRQYEEEKEQHALLSEVLKSNSNPIT